MYFWLKILASFFIGIFFTLFSQLLFYDASYKIEINQALIKTDPLKPLMEDILLGKKTLEDVEKDKIFLNIRNDPFIREIKLFRDGGIVIKTSWQGQLLVLFPLFDDPSFHWRCLGSNDKNSPISCH